MSIGITLLFLVVGVWCTIVFINNLDKDDE